MVQVLPVFWKDRQVEHYTFDNYEDAHESAKELARECEVLEARGWDITIGRLWSIKHDDEAEYNRIMGKVA